MKKVLLTVMMMASLSSFAFEDDIYGSSDVTYTLTSCNAMDRDKLYKKDMKRIQKSEEEVEKKARAIYKEKVSKFLEIIRKYNKYMSKPLNKDEMLKAAKRLEKRYYGDYFEFNELVKAFCDSREPGQYLDEVLVNLNVSSYSPIPSYSPIYQMSSINRYFEIKATKQEYYDNKTTYTQEEFEELSNKIEEDFDKWMERLNR